MFGIGMGADDNEKSTYRDLNSASTFATNLGESDVSKASNFFNSLLSGDSTKIATVLSPQISSAQTAAKQQKKTSAEFGSRSGGTAALMGSVDDTTRANITNLVGSLTGSAASSLASMGTSMMSEGMSGKEAAFGEAKTMHDQNASKWNDVFKSSASVASSVLGALPGNAGGFMDKASNFAGSI